MRSTCQQSWSYRPYFHISSGSMCFRLHCNHWQFRPTVQYSLTNRTTSTSWRPQYKARGWQCAENRLLNSLSAYEHLSRTATRLGVVRILHNFSRFQFLSPIYQTSLCYPPHPSFGDKPHPTPNSPYPAMSRDSVREPDG